MTKLLRNNINKIGLLIEPDGIWVCESDNNKADLASYTENKYEFDALCYQISDVEKYGNVLEKIALDVSKKIGKKYFELNVALADPYVTTKVFEVNHNPRTQKNIDEYIRWLLHRDFYINTDEKEVGYQLMGERNGKYIIIVQICDKKFIQTLIGLFANRNIPVTVIGSVYKFINNYIYDKSDSVSPFQLYVHSKYITFVMQDDASRPVSIKSEWLSRGTNSNINECGGQIKAITKIERGFYQDINNERIKNNGALIDVVGSVKDYRDCICKENYLWKCRFFTDFIKRSDYVNFVDESNALSVGRLITS